MAPPNIRRTRTPRAIKSPGPAITLPTGQPRPLDKETDARSNGAANSASERPRGGAGVEKPRAVEVRRRAKCAARGANRGHIGLREDEPAAAVVRVLDGDEGCWRLHHMAARSKRRLDVLSREVPAAAGDRELNPGVGGRGAAFVPDEMGFIADDHIVAGARQKLERTLVGHGAGGEEERGFLAKEMRDALLEGFDGRILTILIIADFGVRHRLAHGGAGLVTVSERRSMSMAFRSRDQSPSPGAAGFAGAEPFAAGTWIVFR